jgi:hypothetical protein
MVTKGQHLLRPGRKVVITERLGADGKPLATQPASASTAASAPAAKAAP